MRAGTIQPIRYCSIHDIKEAKAMSIVDATARIGVFHTDIAGILDQAHKFFIDIIDIPSDQIFGKLWLDTIFSSDRGRVRREWFLSITHNNLFTSSFRIPDHSHCGLKRVTCSLIPQLSARLEIIGYFGVYVETAARCRADDSPLMHARHATSSIEAM